MSESDSKPKCPYCGKFIESAVPRKIIAIDYDPIRRKQFVGEKVMDFCSADCGGYYQMGCEG